MKKHFPFLLCCFSLLPACLTAQADLRKDADFFEAQIPVYQTWLEQNGLGHALRAHSVQVDTGLILLLDFPEVAPDSAPAVWRQLRADFRRSHGENLEARLFYRAANVFDLDNDHLAVQPFAVMEGCFFYHLLYTKDNQLLADSSTCRGPKSDNLYIQPTDLSALRKSDKTPVSRRTTRARVFELTKTFLQNRYGAKTCAQTRPRLLWTEDAPNSDRLEMEIRNLCDEVIREGQPTLCRALQAFGYPCNWKKNEKLTIRITYTPSGNGFALELWLDGRYGSGFYEEVGRRGYKDMGTDFDEELTAYAKLLKKELNEYLLKYL